MSKNGDELFAQLCEGELFAQGRLSVRQFPFRIEVLGNELGEQSEHAHCFGCVQICRPRIDGVHVPKNEPSAKMIGIEM